MKTNDSNEQYQKRTHGEILTFAQVEYQKLMRIPTARTAVVEIPTDRRVGEACCNDCFRTLARYLSFGFLDLRKSGNYLCGDTGVTAKDHRTRLQMAEVAVVLLGMAW